MKAVLNICENLAGTADGKTISASDVRRELARLPKGCDLTVFFDSGGGSIREGLEIFKLLAERDPVCIVRKACSMASILALAGREVIVEPWGKIMVHGCSSSSRGSADDHRREADKLTALDKTFAKIYATKMNWPLDKIAAAMKAETWWTGREAVEVGYADRIRWER